MVTTVEPISNELETLIVAVAVAVAVAVVAVAATFAAASHIPLHSLQAKEVVIHDSHTAAERCLSMGVSSFADLGQWPKTIAGEDARQVIASRCAVDLATFESDELAFIRR